MKKLLLTILILYAATGALAAEPGTMVPSALIYEYDKTQPLNAELSVLDEMPFRTRYSVEYTSVNGQRVPGIFYLPKKGKRPLPWSWRAGDRWHRSPCRLVLFRENRLQCDQVHWS